MAKGFVVLWIIACVRSHLFPSVFPARLWLFPSSVAAAWSEMVPEEMPEDLMREMCLLPAPHPFDVQEVTTRFWGLMRGEVAGVFGRAASGQLYSPQQSATAKLCALQAALRAALTAGGVPRAVVARWQLYNSNLFDAHGNLFPGCPTEGIEESPVSITLNCAPPPDADTCTCEEAPRLAPRPDAAVPPAWTPDYLSAIRDALIAEGVWPGAVTPLCLECAHEDSKQAY